MDGILRKGKYSAGAAAATAKHAATSALSEPLLTNKQSRRTDSLSSSDDSSSDDSSSDEEGLTSSERFKPNNMSSKDVASTIAVCLFVTGGLAASVSAMIAVPSVMVILMGGICMVNSPTVASKQFSIAKSKGEIKTSVCTMCT
mmetsp:Transcript_28557/g.52111  ORF Transcript_28557/g.52111 Transcript_28557/m.52111 type:complete len:144 (+) Transcript_28557:144-575(+)